MPSRLTDLDITEVSLVDRPANPLSKVVLFKRDTSVEKDDPSADEVSVPAVLEITDKKKKKKRVIAHGKTRKYDHVRKEVRSMPDDDTKEVTTEERVEELTEMVVELQDSLKKRDDEFEALAKELAEEDPSDEDDEADKNLLKTLDPAVTEMLAKSEARVEAAEAKASEAEAIAKAERDGRLTREFISKAETGMAALPGKAEEKAAVLKSVHAVDPELATKVEEMLRSANEQALLGKADEEIGDDSDGDTEASGSLVKFAKSIQAAGEGMSYEDAYVQALDEHPELYTEMIEEVG